MINFNAISKELKNHDQEHTDLIQATTELAVLLCRADKSIKLTEQRYIDEWLCGVELPQGTSSESLLSNAIATVNKKEESELIHSIASRLVDRDFNVRQFAQELSFVDGKICDGEKAIISQLLSHL